MHWGTGRRPVSHCRLESCGRVDQALSVLAEVGGLAEAGQREDRLIIRGASCPLGATLPGHPETCHLAEPLLSGLTGVPVGECQERGDHSRSCFACRRPRPDAPCERRVILRRQATCKLQNLVCRESMLQRAEILQVCATCGSSVPRKREGLMLRIEASRPNAASTRFFACGLRMTPTSWHRAQGDTTIECRAKTETRVGTRVRHRARVHWQTKRAAGPHWTGRSRALENLAVTRSGRASRSRRCRC
jgi:hypothetical protein